MNKFRVWFPDESLRPRPRRPNGPERRYSRRGFGRGHSRQGHATLAAARRRQGELRRRVSSAPKDGPHSQETEAKLAVPGEVHRMHSRHLKVGLELAYKLWCLRSNAQAHPVVERRS